MVLGNYAPMEDKRNWGNVSLMCLNSEVQNNFNCS